MNKLSGLSIFLLVSLAGLMPAQAAPDDGFGRLFSSAAERKKLDTLRQNQKLIVVSPRQDTSPEPELNELPDPITMQGYVKRSDGATTLWVNNKPVQENTTQDNVEIGRLNQQRSAARHGAGRQGSESLDVRVPATGKRLQLKAGQVYEPDTNRIRELRLLEKEKQLNLQATGTAGD
ncbi:hypothetical protein [Methylotenera sp. G11]|uniref:hypothetical protein n=1 Tax=Methylotenera sp. G11 TaxID=1506585 RepID=UPI00064899E6|nr:hypothetical protein [Methylotenera sp. G11]